MQETKYQWKFVADLAICVKAVIIARTLPVGSCKKIFLTESTQDFLFSFQYVDARVGGVTFDGTE